MERGPAGLAGPLAQGEILGPGPPHLNPGEPAGVPGQMGGEARDGSVSGVMFQSIG